ncbi:radical SAM superfamily domain-containing protein [Ditylenchus destructor]|nr:radical SAM superfamily domain-containing protein [Ditylenchus destructor]
MDHVFDLPYARSPHPIYADQDGSHDHGTKIPAWEMIRFSVNIMRGCFGGCTFCSITEHEGRVIQSRSEDSIIREIEDIRDKPRDRGRLPQAQLRLSGHLPQPAHRPRSADQAVPRARGLRGVKKILIGSGLRYDLAIESPEYIQELVTHHVGGYLKIAPEHTEGGPLSKMMKPGIGTYDRFKQLFEAASAAAGKKQYLIPASAAGACTRPSCAITTPELAAAARRAQGNGPRRSDRNGKHHLIPTFQPTGTDAAYESARRKNSTNAGQKVAPNKPRAGQILTQHTGLPPRETGAARTPQRPAGAGARPAAGSTTTARPGNRPGAKRGQR